MEFDFGKRLVELGKTRIDLKKRASALGKLNCAPWENIKKSFVFWEPMLGKENPTLGRNSHLETLEKLSQTYQLSQGAVQWLLWQYSP